MRASDGTVEATIDLAVLQPLVRLSASTERVTLAGAGQAATFGVIGYDRSGNAAPFEPDEVSLSYDQELVTIAPDDAGQWTVTANKSSGSTLVTVRAGPAEMTLPVTVGPDSPVDGFGDGSQRSFAGERCAAASPRPRREGSATTSRRWGGSTALRRRVGSKTGRRRRRSRRVDRPLPFFAGAQSVDEDKGVVGGERVDVDGGGTGLHGLEAPAMPAIRVDSSWRRSGASPRSASTEGTCQARPVRSSGT
ncbi:MAG TPA: hypothetical protein VII47_02905 [Actinomycetota bacterium]